MCSSKLQVEKNNCGHKYWDSEILGMLLHWHNLAIELISWLFHSTLSRYLSDWSNGLPACPPVCLSWPLWPSPRANLVTLTFVQEIEIVSLNFMFMEKGLAV